MPRQLVYYAFGSSSQRFQIVNQTDQGEECQFLGGWHQTFTIPTEQFIQQLHTHRIVEVDL